IARDEIIVYQLVVDARGGAAAASPRKTFGVGFGVEPPPVRTAAWRGVFFTDDKAPQPTPALGQRAKAYLSAIGPEDDVGIEVHHGGGDDALVALARSQRQADALRKLFIDLGLAPGRVRARGRGALAPLAPPTTDAARERNRRIVVNTIPPS